MEMKGNLCTFKRGMVGGGQASSSIFKTADLLGFSGPQPSLGFTENSLKRRKNPVTCSSLGENVLLE